MQVQEQFFLLALFEHDIILLSLIISLQHFTWFIELLGINVKRNTC